MDPDLLVDKLTEQRFELDVELQQIANELSLKRKELSIIIELFESKKSELDRYVREYCPHFSIVIYAPSKTEYYRASYRLYDRTTGKNVPRVVHLGPVKNFNGKDDPKLLKLARNQITTYIQKTYPGHFEMLHARS